MVYAFIGSQMGRRKKRQFLKMGRKMACFQVGIEMAIKGVR